MAKLRPNSFDYLVMALNPALVILLVGSLVFFLIEVFYEGEFQTRLCFIMACFTVGTVGITRIAIELDAARASLYGLALSGAMLFVAPRFALIPIPLLILLLAVIWYSAHRLTWDCTLIDEEQDASGEGLLQRIGLDEAPSPAQPDQAAPKAPLWKRLFAPDQSKHAPGLTIVYFSLAALPIFGVLQGFIPASDAEARGRAFLCLITYVGAGLGLLLTTSLLGLRRYLRQRQVEMPADMTAAWVGVGAGLIVVVLLLATLLPRSARELQLGQSPITFTSREQTARNGGWGKEGAQGEQQGDAQNRNEQNPNGKPGDQQQRGEQPGGEKGQNGQQNGQGDAQQGNAQQGNAQQGKPQQGQGQGQAPDQQQGGDNAQDQNAGGENSAKPSDRSQDPSAAQKGNAPNQPQNPPPHDRNQDEPSQNDPTQNEPNRDNEPRQPRDPNGPRQQNGAQNQQQQQPNQQQGGGPPQNPPPNAAPQNQNNGVPQAPRPSPSPSQSPSNFKVDFNPAATVPFLGWLLKVLIVAAIAIALLYFAIRYRREFLAALRQMLADLANFWRSLFGGQPVVASEAAPSAAIHHPRFSELANPFRRGGAGRPPRELVQETYSALEAWARDHGYPREKGQTAFEFAESLAARVSDISKESKWLADCYSRAAFSSEEVSAQASGSLAAIWQRLEQLYGRIPPPSLVTPPPPPPPGSA